MDTVVAAADHINDRIEYLCIARKRSKIKRTANNAPISCLIGHACHAFADGSQTAVHRHHIETLTGKEPSVSALAATQIHNVELVVFLLGLPE